jgi:cell division protein FtsX
VPKNFLEWANKNFGETTPSGYARLYLKTKDASNPDLLSFLDKKNYKVNKDKTKFGRTKQVIQGIFSGLGAFGILIVIMALMLFSFYLQLVIARSRDNLQLLLMLGYSPGWLSKNVSKQFIPVYVFIILFSVLITQMMQWAFHHFVMYNRPELNTMLSWIVLCVAAGLIILSIVTNYRMVSKLVYKLY